jgi:hypothetical protein
MQITTCTINSLVRAIITGLGTGAGGLGPGTDLNCQVVPSFRDSEKVNSLPKIAVDQATNSGFPIGLGEIGKGREMDIAVHIWARNMGQGRELGDKVWDILLFKTNYGVFPIHDYSTTTPTQVATGQTFLDERGTIAEEDEEDNGYVRLILICPILTHKPA